MATSGRRSQESHDDLEDIAADFGWDSETEALKRGSGEGCAPAMPVDKIDQIVNSGRVTSTAPKW